MPHETYILTRICKCGNKDDFTLDKITAAFELDFEKYWKRTPCSRCGGTKTDSVSHSIPKIDAELLKIWSENPDYQFSQQDEDLLLAKMENLPLLLSFFDDKNLSQPKKAVIASALCTLLFDNLKLKGENYSAEQKSQMQENQAVLLPELIQRKNEILAFKDSIWAYIWKEVKGYFE
ncbi:hypothetical protein [Capnocytophaga sp.]|uniref:hypothetical protein n=1 Tax=Capnocytophaga sp. TaxID=44737 RepID=UPI0026DDC212|nr:hypothetical protein [Capnocytophaga sp.]MDO5106559.1 hypothetical protein [Capnocytophaga sp.]